MNIIDRAIAYVAPTVALHRARSRAGLSILANLTTGYQYGGAPRRSMRGWNPLAQSADQDSIPYLDKQRASSRDLYMNSPVSTAALRRIRTGVIGPGMSLQSRIDRDLIGYSEEAADQWERNTEREFRLWAGSQNCDITRTDTFGDLQALAFLSFLMNGDCFVALPTVRINGWPYATRVQLIEADYVSNPMLAPDNGKIAGGIELDDYGAPVAYHVQASAYPEILTTSSWRRVLAFGEKSGRRNILHLMERERIGQRRGIPILATVIEQTKQLTRLSDAELTAAVIGSFFTAFIKTTPGTGFAPAFTTAESVLNQSGDSASSGANATNTDDNALEMGPGTTIELGENQDVTFANPNRPSGAFEPFFMANCKQLGAAIEVPFEVLMAHYTSSYSASRAALLEAWRMYSRRQIWISTKFCQPVYEEWLSEAVAIGRIRAPGFFENPLLRAAWCGSKWCGPGRGQIDPVKETKAAREKIAGGLSTYEDEYTQISGGDWDSAMERLARQNRRLRALEINTSGKEPVAAQPSEDEGERENDQPD